MAVRTYTFLSSMSPGQITPIFKFVQKAENCPINACLKKKELSREKQGVPGFLNREKRME